MPNSGNDLVITGRNDDAIDTGDGHDLILSGRGNDTIDAGAGNDLVLAGRGDDVVDGGEGNDRILAGAGDDTVQGGAGNDLVLAGRGDDVLIYVASENTDSNDRYDGGRGYDTLRIELTDENWQDPQFRDELDDYMQFVADANYGCGYISNGRFTFDSLGLTVSRIEDVEVFVNGVEVDPCDNPAEANDDATAIVADQATVSGNVLDNDSVFDGVATLAVNQTPAHGTVVLNPDGIYTFTLDQADPTVLALAEGETLTDSFIYEVTDADGDTATATVNVTITGVDDGVVAVDDTYIISAGGGSISGNVLDNDFAPEIGETGSPVTFLSGFQYAGLSSIGQNGGFSYEINSFFGLFDPDIGALLEGEELQDVISYTVTDLDGDTDTAQLKVTIVGVNDRPIVDPLLQIISAEESAETSFDLASIFDDPDADDDGTTLTYAVTNQPGAGVASIVGTELVFDPSGQFETLSQGDSTFEQVTVSATDSNGAKTSKTLDLQIFGENDAPVAANGSAGTQENMTLMGALPVGFDVDGDAVAYGAGTLIPENGSVVINSDGTYTYTPNDEFSGLDSFTYLVSDGNDGSNEYTFTIDVTAASNPPLPTEPLEPIETNAGNRASAPSPNEVVDLATLFTDPEGDAISFSVEGLPTGFELNGSIISNLNPTNPFASGDYILTVTATDATGLSTVSNLDLFVAIKHSFGDLVFRRNVEGSSGDDVLEFGARTGSNPNDRPMDIATGAGDDTLSFGDDLGFNSGTVSIYTGEGKDMVSIGDGNDNPGVTATASFLVDTGEDDDTITVGQEGAGRGGSMIILSGSGNDTINMGIAAGTFEGVTSISSGDGDDVITFGRAGGSRSNRSTFLVTTGDGDDYVSFGQESFSGLGTEVVSLGAGADTIRLGDNVGAFASAFSGWVIDLGLDIDPLDANNTDTIIFEGAAKALQIDNFQAGIDRIDLSETNVTFVNIVDTGVGDTRITNGDGDTIDLLILGVSASLIDTDDFMF